MDVYSGFSSPRRVLAIITGFVMVTLAACSDNDNNVFIDTGPAAQVRVLHASPNAPAVDVWVDDEAVLEDVSYQTGSGYVNVPLEAPQIRVNVAGTDTTVWEEAEPPLVEDVRYTLIAANQVENIEAILLEDSTLELAEGNLQVRVVHAAPAAPAVDVYVTAPDAELANGQPTVENLAFGEASEFLEIPGGDYRIRVTETGGVEPLYDSGTVTLEEGSELTVVALETGPGSVAPITLLALTGDDEEPTINIPDQRGQLRAVHLAPDAPPVDILVNGEGQLSGVVFTDVSNYLPLQSGEYTVSVSAVGTGVTVVEETVEVTAGDAFTFAVVGQLAADTLEGVSLTDELRALPEGEATLRVVHASPDAGAVDVYVDDEQVLSEVAFQDASDYLQLEAGEHTVRVNLAGTETAVIEETVTLESRGVYTVFAAGTADAIQALVVQDNQTEE